MVEEGELGLDERKHLTKNMKSTIRVKLQNDINMQDHHSNHSFIQAFEKFKHIFLHARQEIEIFTFSNFEK